MELTNDVSVAIENMDISTLQEYQCCINKEIVKRIQQQRDCHQRHLVAALRDVINDGFEIYYYVDDKPIKIDNVANIWVLSKEEKEDE